MRQSAEREKVRFARGGTECAAWHYPGSNGETELSLLRRHLLDHAPARLPGAALADSAPR